MSETVVNNRLIAKNTVFLYIRMLVVMAISLYTVRAFLSILGETDYGLYNVIGGVVSIFSFLGSTLSTSSQRYFSQALVKNDKERINRVFCLNLTVYAIFIVLILIILETVGLWFVNSKMTIPVERMNAANAVYQISLITFIIQMLTIPFNALIIAHERMKAFAYIGILEALLKLGFVYVLMRIPFDKLIAYALFFLILYLLIAFVYYIYCRRCFEESHFHFYWNKSEAFEMLGFSGWHLLGTLSIVVRGQGVNILLNVFFNPAVNAARAIAYQVQGAIDQLNNNFFTAVKPQMYKSYSNGELEALNVLVLRSSLLCFFLVSILSVPFYLNTDFILSIWLKDVPQYSAVFTRLAIICGLIDSVGGSAICPALATGKIKTFYLITGGLFILTLPASYVFLRLGYSPESTMIVTIVISVITLVARALILVGLIGLKLKKYLLLIVKLWVATLFIGVLTFWGSTLFTDEIVVLIMSLVVSSLLHLVIYYWFVCSNHDRDMIMNIIRGKMHIK